MGQHDTIERLREYLRQLPPRATALLQAEYERVLAKGEDPVATFVLNELRVVAAPPSVPEAPDHVQPKPQVQTDVDLSALIFGPLVPFLVDRGERDQTSPGQIHQSSLAPLWAWLSHDALPSETQALEAALSQTIGPTARLDIIKQFQSTVATAMSDVLKELSAKNASDPGQSHHRFIMRVGGPSAAEDMAAIAEILRHRDALEVVAARLPKLIINFSDSLLASVKMAISTPLLQTQPLLSFSLALVIARMESPWQIVRLAIAMAETDDSTRVAAHPYGVGVSIAIDQIRLAVSDLRKEVRHGRFEESAKLLKIVHDALRGLRTELDIRNESPWGKRLAAIRVEISSLLESEIEMVPGRVRRLLRQRVDIPASAALDQSEVDETEALIDFVTTCRIYASELAINEVAARTFSDLQQYIEASTKSLVDALRSSDPKVRKFRKAQADAALRFCAVIYGADYAAVMKKAVDVALQDERNARAK